MYKTIQMFDQNDKHDKHTDKELEKGQLIPPPVFKSHTEADEETKEHSTCEVMIERNITFNLNSIKEEMVKVKANLPKMRKNAEDTMDECVSLMNNFKL